MAIPSSVRQCREAFNVLTSDASLGSISHPADPHTRLQDEYGRFRVWIGNVSAHRTGRRSLEYRLRDSSNLKTVVIAFIADLRRSLDGLQDICAGRDGSTEKQNEVANDENVSDSDEDGGPTRDDLIDMALDEIHELISCLLRFSMTLRSPARYDQLRKGNASTAKYYEHKDIEHVTMKYSKAPEYLAQRLGKAISRHREYFRYRDQRHQQFIEGLDGEADAVGNGHSTIATSLRQADETLSSLAAAEVDTDTDSTYTDTSFAPTISGGAYLRPPPLPEAGWNGEPFECPICFGIIEAANERSWRQHINEDLPPYICTFKECETADRGYSRRRDWQHHISTMHRRFWSCPFGCKESLSTSKAFKEHLATIHDTKLDASAFQRMVDVCARPKSDAEEQACDLCGNSYSSTNKWLKHVGHHLEQLTLFALPPRLFSEDFGEESGPSASLNNNIARGWLALVLHAACTRCRQRKTRCDPGLPRCGPCERTNSTCEYYDSNKGQKVVRNNLMQHKLQELGENEVQHKLQELEEDEVSSVEHWSDGDILPSDDEGFLQKGRAENDQIMQEEVIKKREAKEEEQRLQDKIKRDGLTAKKREETAKEREEREWTEFLQKQKEREDKEKAKQEAEKEVIQSEMRTRLAKFGYTESQIDIVVDEEKAKKWEEEHSGKQPGDERRPTYAKVHRDYLSVDTLVYYDIPYEFDKKDPNYIIITREMDKYETEVLFEHTKRIRSGTSFEVLPEEAQGETSMYAWYRKRDRSKSRVRKVGILEEKKVI